MTDMVRGAGAVTAIAAPALTYTSASVLGIVLPGAIVMAGVGATQPSTKSGALLAVTDELSTTASSVLKLVQLSFGAVMTAIMGALAADTRTAVARQSVVLVTVCAMGVVLAAWFYLGGGRRGGQEQDQEQDQGKAQLELEMMEAGALGSAASGGGATAAGAAGK